MAGGYAINIFVQFLPYEIFFPKAVKGKGSQPALILSEHLRFCEGQIHWLPQQLRIS